MYHIFRYVPFLTGTPTDVPGFDGALAACVAAGHAGAASRSQRLLLTVVVTLGCLQVNEVAQLQVCDLWFNYLMS
jgi:hypothetical protein